MDLCAAAGAFCSLAAIRDDSWWPAEWGSDGWPQEFTSREQELMRAFWETGAALPPNPTLALFAAERWEKENLTPQERADRDGEEYFRRQEKRHEGYDARGETLVANVEKSGEGIGRRLLATIFAERSPTEHLGWLDVRNGESYGGPKGWTVESTWLTPSLRGEGLGGALYRAIIRAIGEEGGGKLYSGEATGLSFAVTTSSAKRVWEGLCKEFGCPPGQDVIDIPPR